MDRRPGKIGGKRFLGKHDNPRNGARAMKGAAASAKVRTAKAKKRAKAKGE